MLTPEERAEKLTPTGQPHNVDSPDGLRIFREAIVAQIREAVEEEKERADSNFSSYERVKEKLSLAKAEAYEYAAKIVDCEIQTLKEQFSRTGLQPKESRVREIAERIRALIPKEAEVKE